MKIFGWLATMYGSQLTYSAYCLWVLGFEFLYTIGGLMSVVLPNSSIYIALNDTYNVVAQIQYVLTMGAVFAIMAGFVQWFPMYTVVTMNPKWLKIQFAVMFTSVNMTIFPQHFLGLAWMPRRYTDITDVHTSCNIMSLMGATFSFVSVFMFLFIIWEMFSTNRQKLFLTKTSNSIEWRHNPAKHSYSELPAISLTNN